MGDPLTGGTLGAVRRCSLILLENGECGECDVEIKQGTGEEESYLYWNEVFTRWTYHLITEIEQRWAHRSQQVRIDDRLKTCEIAKNC